MSGVVKLTIEMPAGTYAAMLKAMRFWSVATRQAADDMEHARKIKAIQVKKQQSKESRARSQAR